MNMKAKTLVLTLVLMFAGAAVALAQSPQMGTWKLNDAKSTYPAGMQKNSTVVYEAAGDSVKVTADGTSGDGQAIHTEWMGKFDGKEYPVTGDPTGDARSYTMIDDHTLTMANKKGGKLVTTGRMVVAPDGKTRTLSLNTTDPAGKKISAKAVYEKQ
jgi:hypothetical protein